jgi:DNA primase
MEARSVELRGVCQRPAALKQYPDGATGEPFFQKRVPETRPDWLETVPVTFPSGRSADELCPVDLAHIVWAVNLGCIDLNPWPVRRHDTHHPDELWTDLDPRPGVAFDAVRQVTIATGAVLEEHVDGLRELAARDEREGLGDEPWPPHFPKQRGEPRRVAPSRARKTS